MQSDDVIWAIIGNKQHCSYKVQVPVNAKPQNFCRNEYNTTGLCNRMSCPLANARYATVLEKNGIMYLYQKTAERSHTPSKMWERIKLHESFPRALAQIDAALKYWSPFYINKAKQRLTKLHQYMLRKRRLLQREDSRRTTVARAKKVVRREASREAKALAAAKLETSIKRELLERLRAGTYGDVYNFEPDAWNHLLEEEGEGAEEITVEVNSDGEQVSDEEGAVELEREYVSDEELDAFVADFDGSDSDSESSDEDGATGKFSDARGAGGKRRRRVELEYETEEAAPVTMLNSQL